MTYASTNLPVTVLQQLKSDNPEYLQDGDTLYLIGGFYTADNVNWTTLNTISAINVPGMMNAVMTGNTNLAQFVTTNTSIPQFKVTGGQLGKIGNNFYLTFGHDCEGPYCAPATPPPPTGSQTYTDSIYEFSADPTLASVTILNTITHPDADNSGFRRRDYTLVPFSVGTTPTLFALGGPFTQDPDNALVWTNGINFTANLQTNLNFINQQANQYLSPALSMYSTSRQISYVATFSGLSNLYWGTSGLVYDNSAPYGNILDLISSNAAGNVQEYANLQPLCSGQPVATCLYMGLTAQFIPTAENNYDSRHILQLDQLPQNSPTLVGYIYAGLLSPDRVIFTDPTPSYATNTVYAVYLTPAGSGALNWQNITNMFPGN